MTNRLPLTIQIARTDELTAEVLGQLRGLFLAAFPGRFDEYDWDHALGGHHVLIRDPGSGAVVAHAAVVARQLRAGDQPFRAGYVEAVSTHPTRQGEGIGRVVMGEVAGLLQARFQLGALATGVHDFYRRLGWVDWLGPTSAYDEAATHRTPGEDGAVMVLRFGPSEDLDLTLPISAPARNGADW